MYNNENWTTMTNPNTSSNKKTNTNEEEATKANGDRYTYIDEA